LLFDDKTVAYLLESLKRNPIIGFKAKDIFRASGLSLLGISNSHVEKDLRKIREGTKLSPLLLVRDRNTKVAREPAPAGFWPESISPFGRFQ